MLWWGNYTVISGCIKRNHFLISLIDPIQRIKRKNKANLKLIKEKNKYWDKNEWYIQEKIVNINRQKQCFEKTKKIEKLSRLTKKKL
jgi:hypothetical protein